MQLVASGLGLKGTALQVSFYTTDLASVTSQAFTELVGARAGFEVVGQISVSLFSGLNMSAVPSIFIG